LAEHQLQIDLDARTSRDLLRELGAQPAARHVARPARDRAVQRVERDRSLVRVPRMLAFLTAHWTHKLGVARRAGQVARDALTLARRSDARSFTDGGAAEPRTS